jgi:hypothetical protein
MKNLPDYLAYPLYIGIFGLVCIGALLAISSPFAFAEKSAKAQGSSLPVLRPNQNRTMYGPRIDLSQILLGQVAIVPPDAIARTPIPLEKICLQGTAYWMQRDGLTTASLAVAYIDGIVETCILVEKPEK